jgi:hypothetical protein
MVFVFEKVRRRDIVVNIELGKYLRIVNCVPVVKYKVPSIEELTFKIIFVFQRKHSVQFYMCRQSLENF